MKKRRIAPRLANGDPRDRLYSGLPAPIKDGLRRIARKENKSISWVVEQALIDYFNLPLPKYKGEK